MSGDPVKDAAEAHTSLVIFEQIVGLAESSDLSATYFDTAQKIIKICRAEQQRCLRAYDTAYAKATDTIDRRGGRSAIRPRKPKS